MTPEVSAAVEEIRQTFVGHHVEIEDEAQGGAYVIVHDLAVGEHFKPEKVWLGCLISFQYPIADIYPHFTDPGLTRAGRRIRWRRVQHDVLEGTPGNPDVAPIESVERYDRHRGRKTAQGARMDEEAMRNPVSLRIDEPLFRRLYAHLFPGDGDEHGAVIAAGIAKDGRATRLLAREVFLAAEGIDYVPGTRGYRANSALRSREIRLLRFAEAVLSRGPLPRRSGPGRLLCR